MRIGFLVLNVIPEVGVKADNGGGCIASESSSSSTLIASGDDDDGEESPDTSDAPTAAERLLRSESTSDTNTVSLLSGAADVLQRNVDAREVDAFSVRLCETAGVGVHSGSACQRPSMSLSLHMTPQTLHLNARKYDLDPLRSHSCFIPALQ